MSKINDNEMQENEKPDGLFCTDYEMIKQFMGQIVKEQLSDDEYTKVRRCFNKMQLDHIEKGLEPMKSAFAISRIILRGARVMLNDDAMPIQKTTPPPVIDTVQDRDKTFTCVVMHSPDQPWVK